MEIISDNTYEINADNLRGNSISFPKGVKQSRLVYHYTSMGGLQGIIQNQKLWFTNLAYMNDMDEVFSGIRAMVDYTANEEYRRIMQNINIDEIRDELFACCLSTDRDLLPMWNYYTKEPNGQGYNIHFHTESLARSLIKENPALDGCEMAYGRIDYCRGSLPKYIAKFEKFMVANISRALLVFSEKLNLFNPEDNAEKSEEIQNMIAQEEKEIAKQIPLLFRYNGKGCRFDRQFPTYFFAFIKKAYFAHEREFRFVIRVPKRKKQQLIDAKIYKYRQSNGLMIPYLDLQFSKDAVRGITVSPTVQSDLAEKSLVSFLDYCDYDVKKGFIVRSEIPVRF